MGNLFLDAKSSHKLAETIACLEAKQNSNEYIFEPVDMLTGCTCEGNCDGVPSGCTWH